MRPTSKGPRSNAVIGTRISFVAGGESRTGTVCEISRRANRHKTVFYRVSEDLSIEVDKSDVLTMQSPIEIKNDLIKCLLEEAILENINQSNREVRRYEAANSPYLKGLHPRPVERIGSIRI